MSVRDDVESAIDEMMRPLFLIFFAAEIAPSREIARGVWEAIDVPSEFPKP